MSESMSRPWIRDYFIDVAETYGAQLFNTPASSRKPKKVQLIDFLTYQENSYVWAWISDKDCRVSVRISQDAVDLYKSKLKRNIVDCRFYVVSISDYRPMFSPRPLGPNATGNTPVSHLSLEIGHVKSVGVGGHLFGNPHDLESGENMKEWVSGLRQDGGGGNVLKLRKQQASMQTLQAPPSPPPPPPPPFSLCTPVSEGPPIKRAQDAVKPKPGRPQNLKHAYIKRWKIFEINSWKYAMKPVTEERLNSRPTSPLRTPSPTERQGTPTDWSPSNKGTPAASDKATALALVDGSPRSDQPKVLITPPHLPSHMKRHATADTEISSDDHSLQPPTPAQRIRGSPPPYIIPHPRSSPEVIACSSPHPSQVSSPPLPSSSLPVLSSSLPMPVPMSIRKNIQRKVPHPGLPVTQPASTKNGPVQILVPNSDVSGTGSSQSYPQSQLHSQSQHFQLPSSLANSFKPPDASTPREGKPSNSTRHMSKMSAESSPTHVDVEEQEVAPLRQKSSTQKSETNEGKQGESDSTRPPAPSAPRIDVLEVGTSDTEEETEQLQLTRTTARTQDGVDTQIRKQDKGKGDVGTDLGDDHLPIEVPSAEQSSPPRRPSPLPVTSVAPHPSPNNQNADRASIHHLPQSPERRPVSRSSMDSLFSGSLEYERPTSPHAPVDHTEAEVQEKMTAAHVPKHDPEAWKEPSFLAKRKGKGKALAAEERDAPSVETGKKRGRSVESGPPVPKQAKVASSDRRRVAPGQATDDVRRQTVGAPTVESIHSGNDPSTSSMGTTERTTPPTPFQSSKPRLANFAADFERVNLGKRMPVLIVDIKRNTEEGFLRTGRIRTLGQEVEKDGSAYIMK